MTTSSPSTCQALTAPPQEYEQQEMAKRAIKKTNKTVLLTVEGYTEEAFVRHLKTIYTNRQTPISSTVRNARGYGPQGLRDAISAAIKTSPYDLLIGVLDSDIPIDAKDEKWFRQNKVHLIQSAPCIEATYLSIHGLKVPLNTAACKQAVAQHLPGDPTDGNFYTKHFAKLILDKARARTAVLDELIKKLTTP
ncbi:hypothetical protein [Pseudomonas nitroreducens]|uniref:hypothetical protein n=1 Tax=Pseudomonas nitroreducens TaxID=46680 RepID=UPI001FB831AC|nr:hypothetical protein [Pseudomonas nitroreducens]MCJ1879672.1 hypothetical protein [Pseudomonas nitroreducens]MCJ1896833.1 hypothetical protein [Pseudomonas nitroreducens]